MSQQTVERLRAATETLLFQKGQAAITLRDITDLAETNVASVAYHFGSKDELIADVFASLLEEVTNVQRARLEALDEKSTLEDVVRAWLAPALARSIVSKRELRIWNIIQRGISERSSGLIDSLMKVAGSLDEHLMSRLSRHLPHLSKEELALRHDAALASVAGVSIRPLPLAKRFDEDDVDPMLISWIIGGLRAPATT